MWGKKKPETKTEMKRTCNRCGAERYVALADARLRMPDADKLASARRFDRTFVRFRQERPVIAVDCARTPDRAGRRCGSVPQVRLRELF